MNAVSDMLLKSLGKTFYRENAGFFIFLITMLIGVVSELDGSSELDYHLAMARGALNNYLFLFLVCFAWWLYGLKCSSFVRNKMKQVNYSFLSILNSLNKKVCFKYLILLQAILLLPVSIYSIFIIGVAIFDHFYIKTAILILFQFFLVASGAFSCLQQLTQLEQSKRSWILKIAVFNNSHWSIQFRYLLRRLPYVFLGIKIFTFGFLILTSKNLNATNYDIKPVFIIYYFGIFANSILLHRLKSFEDLYLSFYRSLPIPVLSRFLQHAFLYAVILIPEIITLIVLTPRYLRPADAITFLISGYSILLLLNSIFFSANFNMKESLVLSLMIFFIVYLFLMGDLIPGITAAFLVLSAGLFFKGYYKNQ